MSTDLAVVGLGRMAYGEALELQRTLALRRIEKTIDRDLLLLVDDRGGDVTFQGRASWWGIPSST